MYREGKGTVQDQLEFAHWYWEAAKNGRQDATRLVGWPIQPANSPRLECVRLQHPPPEDLNVDIILHNTRPFVEQMVLVLHAEHYAPGYEPAKPNLEVRVYRIEAGVRTEVPTNVSGSGGGPYSDEARRMHVRNTRIFDETASVFLTFPADQAWLEQFLAEAAKSEVSAQMRENLAKIDKAALLRYLNFPLPRQVGSYEIVAEYQSRDNRFWPCRLTAACRFDVKTGPEFPKQ